MLESLGYHQAWHFIGLTWCSATLSNSKGAKWNQPGERDTAEHCTVQGLTRITSGKQELPRGTLARVTVLSEPALSGGPAKYYARRKNMNQNVLMWTHSHGKQQQQFAMGGIYYCVNWATLRNWLRLKMEAWNSELLTLSIGNRGLTK